MNIPIKINKGYPRPAPSPMQHQAGSMFDIALGFNQIAILVKELEALKSKAEQMIADKQAEADAKIIEIEQLKPKMEDIISTKEQEANDRIESIKIEHTGLPGKDAPPVDEKAIEDRIASRIRQPKDGETPVVDLEKLAKKAAKLIPIPKDGKTPEVDHEEIVKKVIENLKENLKVEHIPGLKSEIDSYRNQLAGKAYGRDTMVRGGGDTVAAGSGVTITTNSNGNKVITAASTILTATGTVDDSNLTFTFTSSPTMIVINGANYRNGYGVTIAGLTVTLDSPVGTGGDIYGLL